MSSRPAFVIAQATEVSPGLVAAFARLLPQLTAGAPLLGAAELQEIVDGPGTALLVAHGPRAEIVGAVTLVRFRIPSGLRARIESLVVDQDCRGQGVGQALCQAALALARRWQVDTVDLTSAPEREAANRLYQRLGFQRRTTHVYRLQLP